MDEIKVDQPRPPIGWAVIELLGHRREVGHLSEEEIADARFLRLATPTYDQSGDETGATIAFYSTAAVYAITPTSERAVRDELAPWVRCAEPIEPDNAPCALRRGHDGDHDPDDGLPF